MRDEKLDEATVELVVRPAVGVSTTTERLWERYLRNAFEPVILGGLMPRTLVQIVVQILKDDGSVSVYLHGYPREQGRLLPECMHRC